MAGITIPVLASLCFIVSHYNGSVAQWRTIAPHLPRLGEAGAIAPYLYWFGASIFLYLVIPAAALLLLREPLREYGWGLGRWRIGLVLSGLSLLVLVPGALLLSGFSDFAEYYPMARRAQRSLHLFVLYEAAYLAYFVAWEHIFRSFLLIGLYRRIGHYAIYATAIPFVVLHLGKPEAEAFISLAIAVGFGYMALWTRSFWWCVLVHGGVAVSMDVAVAWSRLSPG